MNGSCGIKWYNDSEVYNGEHVGLLNYWKPYGKIMYYFLVLYREDSTFGLTEQIRMFRVILTMKADYFPTHY